MTMIQTADLQELCEQGQVLLAATRYWEAERALAQAESLALDARDYDTLSRLYMPLQEARRQRRQRCGEGVVALNLVAEGPADRVDAGHTISNYPQGQLLVAGWGTIEPALRVRELARINGLFVETFLAAAYPVGAGKAIVIVPTPDVTLPPPQPTDIDTLIRSLPAQCIVLAETQLPQGQRMGTAQTFSEVSALWEQLHAPFLAQADAMPDSPAKIEAYRRTIRVDYGCELAHQNLSTVARNLDRQPS